MPPSFHAVATSSTRVRVVFSEPMLQNADLLTPARYALTTLDGAQVSISTIVAEQASSVRSTVLQLGAALVTGRLYRLRITNVVSEAEQTSVSPDSRVFQWTGTALTTEIPIAQFSGEALGGLYGNHKGSVFLSPALETAASNSIIQVEQVDVCSRAYDEYHLPQPGAGAQALMTHGLLVVPTLVLTTLNSTAVLWQGFPSVEARFELGFGVVPGSLPLAEAMPGPVEGPAMATLVETWEPSRVAPLNNDGWKLFDNLGGPYFITADNLSPFPPQPGEVIPLGA